MIYLYRLRFRVLTALRSLACRVFGLEPVDTFKHVDRKLLHEAQRDLASIRVMLDAKPEETAVGVVTRLVTPRTLLADTPAKARYRADINARARVRALLGSAAPDEVIDEALDEARAAIVKDYVGG